MHNMTIEDERNEDEDVGIHYEGVGQLVSATAPEQRNRTREFCNFIQAHCDIRNRETHQQLQEDLIEHFWQYHADFFFIMY
jgi:hypothetical protein